MKDGYFIYIYIALYKNGFVFDDLKKTPYTYIYIYGVFAVLLSPKHLETQLFKALKVLKHLSPTCPILSMIYIHVSQNYLLFELKVKSF